MEMSVEKFVSRRLHPVRVVLNLLHREMEIAKGDEIYLNRAVLESIISTLEIFVGDYDVQMFDEAIVAEYGLDRLRYGDIVAIENADHGYGRIYRTGAVSVGVVVHGISLSAGHGPGVATLFTSTEGRIETFTDANNNLGELLDIRAPSRPGS